MTLDNPVIIKVQRPGLRSKNRAQKKGAEAPSPVVKPTYNCAY